MTNVSKTPRQKAFDLCEEIVWWHRAFGSPVRVSDIMSKNRQKWVSSVRGDCVRRLRSAFGWSTPKIGVFFGLDHTTCLYHIQRGKSGALRSELSRSEGRAMVSVAIERLLEDEQICWAVIPSQPKYSASDNGLIRFDRTGYIRKYQRGSNGYAYITFQGQGGIGAKFKSVHSLVMEAFVGPRLENMQIRHLDGDRFNNRLSNLQYGTAKENADDRSSHGNTRRGVQNGNARIMEHDVICEIRRSYAAGGVTQYELAERHGISQAQINNIVLNKQHKERAMGKTETATGENNNEIA